jgi:enoyl-[acyl-carrier-protein] reductase (NADH)
MSTATSEELAEKCRDAGASITVFSLSNDPDLKRIRELVKQADTPCLFAMDSGNESALA